MKTCRSCGVEKPLDEFIKDKNRPDGRYPYCKVCNAVRRKEKAYWKNRDPLKDKAYRRVGLLRKYGLTEQDYDSMLAEQNYACAICKNPDPQDRWNRFHVDHCHTSGKVRGLLCSHCNTGLGKFYDNTEVLREAIRYLDASKG